MKLNHIGITVSDTEEARAFLENYFGFKGVGANNPKLTHVQDDSGLILSLFRGSKITEPETTHIGFIQETEEQVNVIFQRLKDDGFDVQPPRRSHGWTFTLIAPGGFAIEVVC
jgi:lactoylglutathione lyase